MAYGMQYIPQSNYPERYDVAMRNQARKASVYAADDMVKRNIQSLQIAYTALDAQYGSIEDAIILIEDGGLTVMDRLDAIDAAYKLHETMENGEWELGDSFATAAETVMTDYALS